MVNYAITPDDFLFLSEELGHNIELCTPTQTQSAVLELGFPKGISYTKKKLRGHVIEQKSAIPTETGIIRAIATNQVARVSSKDFKIADLGPNVRISYSGELYQVEHKNEYTHRGVSIYHELKLINASTASGDTVAQPDENLEYIPPVQPTILQNIQTPVTQPDFNF
jgi:hypothetical protein